MYGKPFNNNMMRRGGGTTRTVALCATALILLYGLYAYHGLHTRFVHSEENAEKLRQQHDSLSAQIQVVYEHKSRLEKSLQGEKLEHKKTREDYERLKPEAVKCLEYVKTFHQGLKDLTAEKSAAESRFMSEKQELLNRINSINSEHKMLESQHEDLQTQFAKLQEDAEKQQEDNRLIIDKNNEEYQILKQERENEAAQLKNEVANLHRHNTDLEAQLQAIRHQSVIQQNQIDVDKENVLQLQVQISQLKQQNAVLNQGAQINGRQQQLKERRVPFQLQQQQQPQQKPQVPQQQQQAQYQGNRQFQPANVYNQAGPPINQQQPDIGQGNAGQQGQGNAAQPEQVFQGQGNAGLQEQVFQGQGNAGLQEQGFQGQNNLQVQQSPEMQGQRQQFVDSNKFRQDQGVDQGQEFLQDQGVVLNQQQGQGQHIVEEELRMQVAIPEEQNPYFKVKDAVQDHEVHVDYAAINQGQGQAVRDEEHKDVQQQQVMPPNFGYDKKAEKVAVEPLAVVPVSSAPLTPQHVAALDQGNGDGEREDAEEQVHPRHNLGEDEDDYNGEHGGLDGGDDWKDAEERDGGQLAQDPAGDPAGDAAEDANVGQRPMVGLAPNNLDINMDGILQNEAFERHAEVEARGPGRIMGPEVKDDGERVEGPLGLDEDEGQGQVDRPDVQEPGHGEENQKLWPNPGQGPAANMGPMLAGQRVQGHLGQVDRVEGQGQMARPDIAGRQLAVPDEERDDLEEDEEDAADDIYNDGDDDQGQDAKHHGDDIQGDAAGA